MNEPIDLDANATTPLLPAARDAMFALEGMGNPASSHALGRRARKHLEDAREQTAALLGAHPDEVIFTSGATEANNLAIFGLGSQAKWVLVSPIEHPSVIEPIRKLRTGVNILDVTRDGVVELEQLRPGFDFAVLQMVNHEMGAIQPVRKLAARMPVHTDAAQAVGKMPVHFRELGVVSLAASAHKFRGPIGIGLLLLRRGTPLQAQLFGGHQQQGRRPGTESPMLAVGMAAALEYAVNHLAEHGEKLQALQDRLWAQLRIHAEPVVLNGPPDGLPTTLNVSFPGCRGDLIMMALDLAGVACSTGSACSSGSLLPSPVLLAMLLSDDLIASAVRFSFGPELSLETMDEAARRIGNVVSRIRTS